MPTGDESACCALAEANKINSKLPEPAILPFKTSRVFSGCDLIDAPPALATGPGNKKSESVIIPVCTPIDMTSVCCHNNDIISVGQYAFNYDRWPPLETKRQKHLKYLAAFVKRGRMRVGQELASAEFLTAIVDICRRFGKDIQSTDIIAE